MRLALAALLVVSLAGPAAADFQRVTDRGNFVSLVQNRDLTRLGIRLNVSGDGRIQGRAFGQSVSGSWNWSGEYFCRELYLNGDAIDAGNCQTVEVRGNTVRFTSDQGEGEYADLRLR